MKKFAMAALAAMILSTPALAKVELIKSAVRNVQGIDVEAFFGVSQ